MADFGAAPGIDRKFIFTRRQMRNEKIGFCPGKMYPVNRPGVAFGCAVDMGCSPGDKQCLIPLQGDMLPVYLVPAFALDAENENVLLDAVAFAVVVSGGGIKP